MEEEVAVAVEEAPAALQGPMRAFRGLVAWLESPAAAAALLEEAKTLPNGAFLTFNPFPATENAT